MASSSQSQAHGDVVGGAPGRIRGGRIQKRKHHEVACDVQQTASACSSKLSDSELAYALVDSWTRGLSSASEVQRLAHKVHVCYFTRRVHWLLLNLL
jgi:hypothetical protein